MPDKELPDYHVLKCPKCGNTTDFVEFAMRETKQPFYVAPQPCKPSGCLEWDVFDWLDTPAEPEEIVCGKCYPNELVTVWKSPT